MTKTFDIVYNYSKSAAMSLFAFVGYIRRLAFASFLYVPVSSAPLFLGTYLII